MKRHVGAFLLLFIVSQALLPTSNAEEPTPTTQTHACLLPKSSIKSGDQGDLFDWNHCRPNDFLVVLKKSNSNFYTVWERHKGWVKESDLPGLFALIDSTQPCANVVSAISSFIDPQRSTIGNEAAWLISSFRVGYYPPGLNSTRPKPDIEVLRLWWKERSNTSGVK